MNKTKRINAIENFDFEKFFSNLKTITIDPVVEVINGVETDRFPFTNIALATLAVLLFHACYLDYILAKALGLEILFPYGMLWYPYKFFLMLLPTYIWGVVQVALRIRLTKRLTQVFLDAGLKSVTGRLPAFISDVSLDKDSRRLRLRLKGQKLDDFKNAKGNLEASLQIHIDEIKSSRKSGTVDILYSYKELTDSFLYKDLPKLKKDHFFIGMGRTKVVQESLSSVPHLLVAGQTGGGKSTFIRQLLTSMYLTNKDYQFELIDLKGGLEFQTFENLPRVNVHTNTSSAIILLKEQALKAITQRAELFKHNECKDIEAFLKIPRSERKYPSDELKNLKLNRRVIVVDEAAELFRVGAYSNPVETNKARTAAAKIAAQGRALGIHLIISTQKPNVKSVDGDIKTNLTGRVCFRMSDIASSNTILDNKRAAELSDIKGRAVWRSDSELIEVQAPFLEEKDARALLDPFKKDEKVETKPTEELPDGQK